MAEIIAVVSAAAAAVTALFKAKNALWDPLMKKIASSKNVKEISDPLKESVEMLESLRKDYENIVQTYNTKVPSESFKRWIDVVKETEDKVKILLKKYETAKSFFSSRPNFKEMKRGGEKLGRLWEQGLQIKDEVLVDPKPESVVKKIGVPEIKEFETLQKPFEKILDLLGNEKVDRIGICGPLGIGKSTIMWNLNNHEVVAKMFEIVIWVKVSSEDSKENLSRESLQEVIVQRLKIKLGGNSNADEVEKQILMALEGKRYLLLLDDVKKTLNLSQLGIPHYSNGSKLVLTTRHHHVCSMVDRVIKVKCLSQHEAWKMFQNVLRDPKVNDNLTIGSLARRVSHECCGLPLMIEKVANTFKMKRTERLWSHGFNSWRRWPEKECQDIRELYKSLKFCYDDLDDDQRKECFLYSALYPEDSDIYTEYLLECWAAEDFLGNDGDAHEVRLISGDFVLTHLKNVSLLEESQIENHVTMHKCIRQVALYILEDDPQCKYLVKTRRELSKPLVVESWLQKKIISFGDNMLDKLPDSPNCSILSTLFLQKNGRLKMIPASFFKHMENLRVLDLSHTGIEVLPSSLSILSNLKVLCLHNCKHLAELPSSIGELVHLETLDIQGSGVNNIPPNIEKLICLRRLGVSFTKYGNGNGSGNATQEVHFDYKKISELSKLEELVIDMKSTEQWSNEVAENILKEVATLKKFTTLKFSFSNKVVNVLVDKPVLYVCVVPKATTLLSFIERRSWDVQSIDSFKFFIGCQNPEHQIPNFLAYEKYVKYCNGAGSNFPIPEVLAEADAFELANHKDIKQLSDLGSVSMNKIQGFLIESCEAIETIMGTMDSALLPNLRHLFIKNLPRMKSIWKDPSLPKLSTLVITSCQTLSKIFPPGVIQQLPGISYLKIEDCPKIEEMVSNSDVVGNLPVLPNLKKLILVDMPKLRSICAIESLEWPSLEKLKILKCQVLHKLPFNKGNTCNTAKPILIKAEQLWWQTLERQNPEAKEQIEQFCTLRFV